MKKLYYIIFSLFFVLPAYAYGGAYDSLPSIGGSTMDGISASMQGSSYAA